MASPNSALLERCPSKCCKTLIHCHCPNHCPNPVHSHLESFNSHFPTHCVHGFLVENASCSKSCINVMSKIYHTCATSAVVLKISYTPLSLRAYKMHVGVVQCIREWNTMHHFASVLPSAVCNPPCIHGACVRNNSCSCSAGYIGTSCTNPGRTNHVKFFGKIEMCDTMYFVI